VTVRQNGIVDQCEPYFGPRRVIVSPTSEANGIDDSSHEQSAALSEGAGFRIPDGFPTNSAWRVGVLKQCGRGRNPRRYAG
jgi:hypothetical protein